MSAWFTDINPFCCQWLRNLIDDGFFAGEVQCADIRDLRPEDIPDGRCHFFAGASGWEIALRLAGWPDERPAWTGSCPCQPFSTAGLKRGERDERHLWPAWLRLIEECRPPVVFGEQVAGTLGRSWLSRVRSDLEGRGYAVGMAYLPACSVGAPHKRGRYWFVAVADGARCANDPRSTGSTEAKGRQKYDGNDPFVGDVDCEECQMATCAREGHSRPPWAGFWKDCERIVCPDGRTRVVEPGVRTLVDGLSANPPAVRAYGNAIVPQIAAVFVKACMEWIAENR